MRLLDPIATRGTSVQPAVYGCIDRKTERGAADDVEREVCSNVHASQADNRYPGRDEAPCAPTEMGPRGDAEHDGDACVSRGIAEAGRFAPRTCVSGRSDAGRGRRVARLTSFEAAHVATPPMSSRVASRRSPTSRAMAAATGVAPTVPSCMTSHAGPNSASGSRLTARKSSCSRGPTEPRRRGSSDAANTAVAYAARRFARVRVGAAFTNRDGCRRWSRARGGDRDVRATRSRARSRP